MWKVEQKMELKYRDYHRKCAPCPPRSASVPQGAFCAFRMIENQAIASADFKPPAIKNPARRFETSKKMCSGYALSYFCTEDQLKKFHKKLTVTSKQFAKRHKFYIRSEIECNDGVTTAPNNLGHFDLHEAKSADLQNKSVVVGEI